MNQLGLLRFRLTALSAVGLLVVVSGCWGGRQFGRVVKPGEKEMVGSHQAGQETFRPLIDESVSKLIARHDQPVMMQVSGQPEPVAPPKLRVCFVGVENKTAEEIGDFKEQIYETIDARLLACGNVVPISRRFVEAGLNQLRLRPDELFLQNNMRAFTNMMEQQGQPFDFLVFAKLTSGTTRQNKNMQRDYMLTLEMVNIRTGSQEKETAQISKGYHHTMAGRAVAKWPWGQQ